MKWSSREHKVNKRRKIKLQDRVHRDKGKGKDKQSKKRMAQMIRERRKFQELEGDEYWTEYNGS